MKISKNFKKSEFEVSSQFPSLVEAIPKSLEPNVEALVLKLLQPICDATGYSCIISSGYRAQMLNVAVGGVPTSMHLKAQAADCVFKHHGLHIDSFTILSKVKALNLDFDQMIAYPTFVHLSYTTERPNRKQVLYSKNYKGLRI